MKHRTEIDTIGIRIDFHEANVQRKLLHDLLKHIIKEKMVYVSDQSTEMMNKYDLFWRSTTIASIRTGTYRSGCTLSGFAIIYYINIEFAGLKKYHDTLDDLSYSILINTCAFLNTMGISYTLTELDVCIDMECKFENVLAVCTKKSPKTEYCELADKQYYEGETAYIEKLTKNKRNIAVLRAYTYDKRVKENLAYDLTRFELKLQSKFFNKYGFSIDAIEKALDRYHVMYFDNLEEKNTKISAYNSYALVKKREVRRMKFDNYRIYPDIKYIADFLNYISTVTFPR